MEQKIETGGPAFPVQYSNEADGPTVMPHVGMTLRDYFAAKAMQGFLTAEYASTYRPEVWAKDAYEMADAMLKARDHGAEGSENDRHVATFLLREALKSCLEYGAMTGADWVTDKARAALAKAGEPR